MIERAFSRLPRHVGLIPDGNRRWAQARGRERRSGYPAGIEPGLRLVELCRTLGIPQISVYGFTKENVHRPVEQVEAFRRACVGFAERVAAAGAALLVVGDMRSKAFPAELERFAERSPGDVHVNLLVNYGWRWDLRRGLALSAGRAAGSTELPLASSAVPRVDLVVRWGGRSRLSGFLPIQCAYSDVYVVDTLWPDSTPDELCEALRWYERQDVTIGG